MNPTALRSPFPTTIDAILHFYPLTSPDSVADADPYRRHPEPPSETSTLTSLSVASGADESPSDSPLPSGASTPRLSAILLPAPYVPYRPPSRFVGRPTLQIESPVPRRVSAGPPSSPHRTHAITMETSSPNQNLAAPRVAKAGSSPSRQPHPLNALSPLQSFSPLQSVPVPKTAGPESAPSDGRGRLVRSMSRKQSMYASAAQWEKGQYERALEAENMSGGLFSKITLVKAPDQESGLKK